MRACGWFFLLLAPCTLAEVSLQERVAAIQSLQGTFSQQVLSAEGLELERSSGQFKLLQPGYFSWHIRSPDEQLLLATGNTLLHYDAELETATRRVFGAAEARGPLAILSGDGADLSTQYQIEQLREDTWLLRPKAGQADIVDLTLSFEGALPARMVVLDQLRQTTVIEFGDMRLNPPLEPADFEFEPPPGVDLLP